MLVCASSNQQQWHHTFRFLSKFKTHREINQIHARLITTGKIYNNSILSKLILNLSISPNKPILDFARHLLCEKNFNDTFLWNAIIKAYSHGEEPQIAFNVFALMLVRGVVVDEYSFSLLLKSCSRSRLANKGMQIHGLMSKFEFGSDVFLQNCIICMYIRCGLIQFGREVFDRIQKKDSFSYNLMIDGYVKCGNVSSARELFDSMPIRMKNLISWNTIISGYVKSKDGFEYAMKMFDKMPERDLVSWNLMIDCCAKSGKMGIAHVLFERMTKRDMVSWASMIDGYSRIGKVDVARVFFNAMPKRDVISCNVMISGYVNNGFHLEALAIFHDMLNGKHINLAPDHVTLLTALSATIQLGYIEQGIAIHNYIKSNKFSTSGKLGVALIDMYSKCGSIKQALDIFHSVQEKSIDHWNAMIGGMAIHGRGDLAFEMFIEMEKLSLVPDSITFIAVLNACGHSGIVKEGLICFEIMRRYHKIEPELQHYGCMVDILSRSGHFEEAARFVEGMPIEPNDVVWRTLLSACTNQENLNLGEPIAKHMIEMDSNDSSWYVLLSNMYAQFGLWGYVRRIRAMMKERELSKIRGCSSIELEGTLHEFFAGSRCNNHGREIYSDDMEKVHLISS